MGSPVNPDLCDRPGFLTTHITVASAGDRGGTLGWPGSTIFLNPQEEAHQLNTHLWKSGAERQHGFSSIPAPQTARIEMVS
jgi:hypothetical protein